MTTTRSAKDAASTTNSTRNRATGTAPRTSAPLAMPRTAATGVGVAAVLLLAAGPALAEDEQGLYVGGGLGDFSTNIDAIEDIDQIDDVDFDDNVSKIFAGWRFNRFLGVQLDYVDLGKSTEAVSLLNVTRETDGIMPSVVGTLPIGPIELFAKAGMIFYNLEVNTDGGQVFDESGEDLVYGVGIGFTFLDRLNVAAEYEKYDIDELDNADALWLTASWRF
jgi:OmpA-OmpF porin, OOP family